MSVSNSTSTTPVKTGFFDKIHMPSFDGIKSKFTTKPAESTKLEMSNLSLPTTAPATSQELTVEAAKAKLGKAVAFSPFKAIDAKVNNTALRVLAKFGYVLASIATLGLLPGVQYVLHNRTQSVLHKQILTSVDKVVKMVINANATLTDTTNVNKLGQKQTEAEGNTIQAQLAIKELASLVKKKAGPTSAVDFAKYAQAAQCLVADQLQNHSIARGARIDVANGMLQGAFVRNILDTFYVSGIENLNSKSFEDVVKGLSALYGNSKSRNEIVGEIAKKMREFGDAKFNAEIERIGKDDVRAKAAEDNKKILDKALEDFQNQLKGVRGVKVGETNEFESNNAFQGEFDKNWKKLDAANKALAPVVAEVLKALNMPADKASDPKALGEFLSKLYLLTPDLKTKLDAALRVQSEAKVEYDNSYNLYVKLVGKDYGLVINGSRITMPSKDSQIGSTMDQITNVRVNVDKEFAKRAEFLNAVKEGKLSEEMLAGKIA